MKRDPRHRAMLGSRDSTEDDVRGEHRYPDEPEQPVRVKPETTLTPGRTHYMGGAEGTQEIPEPEE